MSKNSTNKVSRILTTARERGDIPWAWVVDEHRAFERVPQWDNPAEFTESVRRSYRRDRWQQQPRRVEVWSEKGTMRGTLMPVLVRYGVGFRVLHGYSSATVMNGVAEATKHDRQPLLVFYLGDWDPSGLQMSDVDIPGRLARYGGRLDFRRLALTADDLTRPDMAGLAFPATDKIKDSRYRWFARQHGDWCWELDALSPVEVRDRLEAAIGAAIDPLTWTACARTEDAELHSLADFLADWRELHAAR